MRPESLGLRTMSLDREGADMNKRDRNYLLRRLNDLETDVVNLMMWIERKEAKE